MMYIQIAWMKKISWMARGNMFSLAFLAAEINQLRQGIKKYIKLLINK